MKKAEGSKRREVYNTRFKQKFYKKRERKRKKQINNKNNSNQIGGKDAPQHYQQQRS